MKSSKSKSRTTTALSGYDMDDSYNGNSKEKVMKSSKSKSRPSTALNTPGFDSSGDYDYNPDSSGITTAVKKPANPNGLTEMPSTTSPDVLIAQSRAIKKAKGGGQSSTILTKSQNKPGQARTPLSPDMLRLWRGFSEPQKRLK